MRPALFCSLFAVLTAACVGQEDVDGIETILRQYQACPDAYQSVTHECPPGEAFPTEPKAQESGICINRFPSALTPAPRSVELWFDPIADRYQVLYRREEVDGLGQGALRLKTPSGTYLLSWNETGFEQVLELPFGRDIDPGRIEYNLLVMKYTYSGEPMAPSQERLIWYVANESLELIHALKIGESTVFFQEFTAHPFTGRPVSTASFQIHDNDFSLKVNGDHQLSAGGKFSTNPQCTVSGTSFPKGKTPVTAH
jgi:hypothetical protein